MVTTYRTMPPALMPEGAGHGGRGDGESGDEAAPDCEINDQANKELVGIQIGGLVGEDGIVCEVVRVGPGEEGF